MKYCSDTISRKIHILSFIATISVVIIHTNAIEGNREVPLAWWIGNLIGYAQRWSVPFFFIVSGFFLHRSFFNDPHWSCVGLLRRKVRSLVWPYLIWGGIYGTLTMTLLQYLVARSHGECSPWSCTIFASGSILTIFDRIVGITMPPCNGALWYLRILLLSTFFSPLWMRPLAKSRVVCLIVALMLIISFPLTVIDEELMHSSFAKVFNFNAFGWILLGVFASLHKAEDLQFGVKVAGVCVCAWLFCCFCPLPYLSTKEDVPTVVRLIHRVAPIFFMITYWKFGDALVKMLPEKVDMMFKFGFWIYCMHHPITGYMSALFHTLFGHSLLSACIYQALGWVLVLTVCLLSGFFVWRTFPSVFTVIIGGRVRSLDDSNNNKRA